MRRGLRLRVSAMIPTLVGACKHETGGSCFVWRQAVAINLDGRRWASGLRELLRLAKKIDETRDHFPPGVIANSVDLLAMYSTLFATTGVL